MLGSGKAIELENSANILQRFLKNGWPIVGIVPQPDVAQIDWGAVPPRTNKAITLRCSAPASDIKEQNLGGQVFKFTQKIFIDSYVRAIKSEGLRLGREPDRLVAMEKWLTEYLAVNRLSLQDEGIQYIELLSAQTTPEVVGGEENQQVWYHLQLMVALHYWLRTVVVT